MRFHGHTDVFFSLVQGASTGRQKHLNNTVVLTTRTCSGGSVKQEQEKVLEALLKNFNTIKIDE